MKNAKQVETDNSRKKTSTILLYIKKVIYLQRN